MSSFIKQGGSYAAINDLFVKSGGAYVQAQNAYKKVAGSYQLFFSKPVTAVNPEAGLTLTESQSAGVWTLNTNSARLEDVVLAMDVVFPTAAADGTLVEKGGAGQGTWIGIRDGGTVFRARSGDGGLNPPNSLGTSDLSVWVDITDFPTDGATHTVVWEVRINPGRGRLWIDGELKGENDLVDRPIENSRWEGGAGGMFLTGGGANVNGEPTGDWPGGTTGQLRMYQNQLTSL